MYKLYYDGNITEFENYDEVVAHVTDICSQKFLLPELNLRVTIVNDNGNEIPVFKSHKIMLGQKVWISKVIVKTHICTECDGNGIIEINKFRQTQECDYCNGKGTTRETTNLLEPDGPYLVIAIDKKIASINPSNFMYKKDWVILKNDEKLQVISIHQIRVFDSRQKAVDYIAEFNQIKEAEAAAQNISYTGEDENENLVHL